jgi:hypothetical protein
MSGWGRLRGLDSTEGLDSNEGPRWNGGRGRMRGQA